MRTPYGGDCKHYYADFNRGRATQECRLPRADAASEKWAPGLCRECPVPRIQLANACPHLILHGRINRGFLGLNRKMIVGASCRQTQEPVTEPAIGCGRCHEAEQPFRFTLE